MPCYFREVLPGDSFDLKTNFVVRMSTPIHPVYGDAFIDFAYFFVPYRLLWDHWEEFNGENKSGYWTQPVEYTIPQMSPPEGGWDKGSLADHLGLATKITGESVSALPFRAYVKVWNDWWRDQNTMPEAYFVTDDNNRVGKVAAGTTISDGLTDALYGGRLLNACKFHDYFTSVLPSPQKGPEVEVGVKGLLPVVTGENHESDNFIRALRLRASGNDEQQSWESLGLSYDDSDSSSGVLSTIYDEQGVLGGSSVSAIVEPTNLWADSSVLGADGSVLGSLGITINDLRMANSIQRLYERDALGGSRYIEVIRSHFGVISPDARLQRSEYLGGMRHQINMSQVLQTSATNDVSPQGNASGFSMTVGSNGSFVKSFTEHGAIIGLVVCRVKHSYQQSIERFWSRKRRFDFYWPELENISEQAVLKKEIFANTYNPDAPISPNVDSNNEAFGYQSAWADYKYHPDLVTGAFRSNYDQSLDVWHYADYFEGDNSDFVVDQEFMWETPANIDRTLAVSSEVEDQFIMDYQADVTVTRCMGLHSIPGLSSRF